MVMQWYYWLIVGICVVLSAFFSSADMVYSVVNHKKLLKEIKKGNKAAKIAYKLAEDYDISISSILFGNNLVNILGSSIVTIMGNVWNPDWGITAATLIFVGILILLAEYLPKSVSKKYSYRLSLLYAYPILVFKYISFIFVWPISKLFSLVGKLFVKKSKEEDQITEDELTSMIDELQETGDYQEDEAELIKSAIDISDIEAHEIMTPRVDVFMVNVEENIEEIMDKNEVFAHSRIPVYKDTIDNVIGILPIKQLLKARIKKEENIDLLSLCYEPLRVPRNRQILDLLREFKKSKIHIALIMDEYGGIEGVVTMEDILEQIVGDIFDETDEIEEEYIDNGDGVYIVDGSMNIEDFFELIEFHEEFETDYSTVSGLCQEVLDRFAVTGDEFMFKDRYKFIVLSADEFTVEKLKVIDNKFGEESEE